MAKSADYWKRRFSAVENTEHEAGLSAYQEIEKQYQQAQKAVSDKLAVWYERLARNNDISLQEAKKLLSRGELREFKWDVNDYIRYGRENAVSQQWMKELENASARAHISRLEAIKLQMQQQVEVMFGNQLDTIDKAMRDVYQDGYYRTAYEIQKGTGIGMTLAAIDTRKVDAVLRRPWAQDGSDFSSRIWKNKDALVQQLNTTLTQNVIRGEDPQRAIDAIAERMDVSKTAAGRLVMTEEAAFSSAAQKDCFKELGVSEYEVVVTLDDATCDECASMDGMIFKMSDYAPGSTAPPFHCFCRCTTIPHIDDDFGDVGERAARSEDGRTYHIPADMTYKEWKKLCVDSNMYDEWKHSAARQLGVDYHKFKSGKIIQDNGYSESNNKDEMSVAKWISETFGGEIRLVRNDYSKPTPDYIWNGQPWDLKSPQGTNGVDKLVHHGIHQAMTGDSGGVILDISNKGIDSDKAIEIAQRRLDRSRRGKDIKIVVKKGNDVVKILK